MKNARFVYATNSSFCLLENPHFVNMIQSLRLGHSPPSRLDVAGKLLDKVYEEEIMQCATSLEGKIVNLSLDGWSNVHNDHIVCACITTEEGNVFLAETIDTSGNVHTAAYLEELAAEVIITCKKNFKCQVRSLVTDNAANVSKMRRNVEQHEVTTKLITYGSLALKIVGGTKLTLPQDIRWNSVVDCFEQYIKNSPILMTICEQNREKIDGTITAKILNIGLKRNVEHMLSILKPVSEALNKIQKNSLLLMLSTLSAEEEELAMTWVSSNHPSLVPTIMNFRAKGEPCKKYMFADEVLKKVSPVNWWKSLKHLDSESVEVMISLLTAVASSAGVERIFSSFGLVHSKLRNPLGPDKAGKLVFLFQIMNKQENEDENE
ncbi:hypothetical protein E2320_000136 [Naja naja]|nr:hypothetical protein E2320_000136 [Naja naja]